MFIETTVKLFFFSLILLNDEVHRHWLPSTLISSQREAEISCPKDLSSFELKRARDEEE